MGSVLYFRQQLGVLSSTVWQVKVTRYPNMTCSLKTRIKSSERTAPFTVFN
jgi:hypothetical protein